VVSARAKVGILTADYRAVTRKERALVVAQLVLLAGSVVVAGVLSDARAWDPPALVVLLVALAVVSEAFRLETKTFGISAAFLSIVLAMILLGPAPSVLVGTAPVLVDALRRRAPWRHMLANLSTYAFFPLVGALLFEAIGGPAAADDMPRYVLSVFVLFLGMNLLNFVLIGLDFAVVDGQPLRRSLRQLYVPVLPVEVATGLLTAGVAFAYDERNLGAVGLLALVGLVVQYLLRTALSSIEHKEQLEGRSRQLAALQVGLLGTVLQTLSLRDKMTARHSAAVARYACEIARELGLSEREQEIVHTAGLLHDIGKFIFPDSILFAETRLTDEQMAIVRRHPEQGARLVKRIEGYGPIAGIVLAHHERIDGNGYPNGIAGDDIPLAARIISVADTYDVMTARDSYRRPVPPAEAVAELRRVSGAQLDGRVVEAFVRVLDRRGVSFRHADDADFERELNLERRVRDYAAPRAAA
jgi:putative nucleotidyltransferase with HDIG domain